MELTNWKTLYKKEAWGNHNFGVEIRVSVDRPLLQNDETAMYKIGDMIEDAIMRETMRNDAGQQKEHDAEKAHFQACFPEGMVVLMEPIPNQYCSRWCCEMSPWYKVTTPMRTLPKGRITRTRRRPTSTPTVTTRQSSIWRSFWASTRLKNKDLQLDVS